MDLVYPAAELRLSGHHSRGLGDDPLENVHPNRKVRRRDDADASLLCLST